MLPARLLRGADTLTRSLHESGPYSGWMLFALIKVLCLSGTTKSDKWGKYISVRSMSSDGWETIGISVVYSVF
jgi:hypothetical protein